jgi:hypothetical protein
MLAGNEPPAVPAFELIQTTTVGTAAATVQFANINGYTGYTHLQVRAVGQVNIGSSAGLHNVFVRLNSDTGSNYAYHHLYGDGVNDQTSGSSGSGFMLIRNAFGSQANGLEIFSGAFIMDLLDYKSTNKTTTMRALGGSVNPDEKMIGISSSLWNNTAEVTTILFYLNTGSFNPGTRFSLYGIKGE